ncbi:MAG: bifunctional riboflavin kinase/FAD synthetase [Gammaproteobacteria bacterium]|jgi:riboflavin kinase/FMN adenylyltransferase|nr:bifunctional riboflavin kinase/FAD synthetase [Gammaproteobacteria bacterium]
MELIRGLHNLRPRHRGCVATIGNFDGVHLGHQTVLGQLANKGAERGLPTQVIVFEPLPREFFAGAKSPARLTRFREKVLALRRFSVDRLLCMRFDRGLANMAPDEFVRRILVDGLGVNYLVVGDDFRYGRERGGDFGSLEQAGRRYGFDVAHMHTFEIDGNRVSSTRIRKALEVGDLSAAEMLLGRPYRMSGKVTHGDKRGRTIGFPTANIQLARQVSPVIGVYAVEMYGLDREPLPGVANVGRRPTVGGVEQRLEVHLFDFDRDIYQRHVDVEFQHKLRDEKRFDSVEALIRQIEVDVEAARSYFATRAGR